MPKLRPINETRRANGQLTSETAKRLKSRRGGINNFKRNQAIILPRLASNRIKSIITRRSKALTEQSCMGCQSLAIHMTEQLSKLEGLYLAQLTILRKQIP